jgi:hypothetical protein
LSRQFGAHIQQFKKGCLFWITLERAKVFCLCRYIFLSFLNCAKVEAAVAAAAAAKG